MSRKLVLLTALIIILVGTLSVTFNVQRVKASATIYIRANGDVEGTDKIERVGEYGYIFTDNINDSIVIERDNIVVDGAGYALQGTGSGTGISLSYRSNVTIKNMEIKSFSDGINLFLSDNNTISGNNITNNEDVGIYAVESSNDIIGENDITNNENGIYLEESSNNKFYHNNFINNTQQLSIHTYGIANFWDDSVGKGNYWSDYEDRYPNATEIDGSGIWDTPYVIDENNQDNYPIVPEFPSFLIMALFMLATLLTVIVYKRKHTI